MPLYTEEQLSMILSAHAAGRLVRWGAPDFKTNNRDGIGCVNQIAFNEPNHIMTASRLLSDGAYEAALWFDHHYLPDIPAEDLLRKLESF